MAGPARPSLDVDGTLDDVEWLELFRESLRLDAFWPRLLVLAGVLISAVALTGLLGMPLRWITGGVLAVAAVLATYVVGYVRLGPRLRARRVDPADRTARWRISADRLRIDQGGRSLDLAWRDIDRVRVTDRLVTFELTGGRGLLALPRRTATALGESLVLGWAEHAGTPVSRPA